MKYQVLIKGILTGNFRQWGAPQYRQWQSILGCWGHTGFELEFLTPVHHLDTEQVFKWSHSKEIQWLVPTIDPIQWYKEMQDAHLLLKKLELPTTGSIHCNTDLEYKYRYVGKEKFLYNWECGNFKSDAQKSNRRLENKEFSGYIIHKDLLLQCLLWGIFLKNNLTQEELIQLHKEAKQFYTKLENTFSMDYTEQIQSWYRSIPRRG